MKKIITIIVCILLVAVVITVGFIATRPQKNDTAIKTLKVNDVTRSVFYAPQYNSQRYNDAADGWNPIMPCYKGGYTHQPYTRNLVNS